METKGTKLLFSSRFLFMKSREWTRGEINGIWNFVERPGDPEIVVVCGVRRTHPTCILVREFRVPIDNYIYALPAGIVDKGESIEAAAARELKEETGLDILKITFISPKIYSSPGLTNESFRLVHAEIEGESNTDGHEGAEEIEVIEWEKATAIEQMKNPSIQWDCRAWMVLYGMFGDCLPCHNAGA